MLCETVMIVPFLKASASPKIKPTWNGPEITSRFHGKSKGGWGGVFDAPAAPNRGVEDSAPATPGLLVFREVISGLFLRKPRWRAPKPRRAPPAGRAFAGGERDRGSFHRHRQGPGK